MLLPESESEPLFFLPRDGDGDAELSDRENSLLLEDFRCFLGLAIALSFFTAGGFAPGGTEAGIGALFAVTGSFLATGGADFGDGTFRLSDLICATGLVPGGVDFAIVCGFF